VKVHLTPGCMQASDSAPTSLDLAGHLDAINNALAASQALVQALHHVRVTLHEGGFGGDLVGGSQERNTQKKGDKQREAEGSHLEVVVR